MEVRFIPSQFSFIADCHKGINFKIRFFGNMTILINTFKNMAVKFVGGCSVATRSYAIKQARHTQYTQLSKTRLKFTVEKGKNSCEQIFDTFVQVLNLLDVSVILHKNSRLENDIFIKKRTRITILTILVTIQNTQSKTYHII